MNDRLATSLEVAGLCRRAEAGGGFAAVVRRGDPDRGDLVILVSERGVPRARLERRLGADFAYSWNRFPSEEGNLADLIAERARLDPDFWLIELDIADAERFVAEMIETG